MPRHLRRSLLVVLVLAASCVPASGALAAIAPGCANPVDSALNQYCDTIPGPTGAQAPKVGSPSLATALPRSVVTRIEGARGGAAGERSGRRSQTQRRRLLSLPAPGPRTPLSQSAITESSLMPLWLILVLIGIAVALTTAKVASRYRRRGEA